MKSLRSISLIFFAFIFTASAAMSINALANDDTPTAVHYAGVAGLSLTVPALAVTPGVLGLTRVEEHLLNYLNSANKVDAITRAKYMSGELRFIGANFYIRKLVTGLNGRQIILDERDDRTVGITNIHAGRLPKKVNAAIDRILIGYATHASEVDPEDINTYSSVVSDWPAVLRSSELIIKQDGNMLNDPIPAALCGSTVEGGYSLGKFDAYQLPTPIVLEEEKQTVIELDLAGAAGFATNQEHVEIYLLGVKTRERANI